MTTVNMHHAKTHLSRLVDEAVSGKEVVIAKAGRPMVRLVPVERREGPRIPGALAGQVREIDPGWWGADPDLEARFYGASETDPLEDRGKNRGSDG